MAMTAGQPETKRDGDLGLACAITETVAGMEWIGAIIFLATAAICVGVPLVRGIWYGHPLLGLANAILLGLAGLGLLFLINLFVLIPVTVVRYGRAASLLGKRLAEANPAPAMHRSWSDRTPGAITVAGDGRVWLADRSTGYRPLALQRSDIIDAEPVTIHSGRRFRVPAPVIGVGVPLGGGLMVTVPLGRGRRVPRDRVRYAMSLRYRSSDGIERSTLIPFGADGGGSHAMSKLLGGPSNRLLVPR